jgi:hypothetical protein
MKIINEWQPIMLTLGAKAPHAFPALGIYDASTPFTTFVQTIMQGSTTATAALTQLQQGLATEADPTKP